ncbi:hypothetical protein T492DRAFT_875285 [Pavlovales sp. CCMP2436]|nr:hypothetical protein T492DRAFT_875285 [Pavlovales sp. CCMP2436]|mmetsp:Transcript_17075/g.43756  ORF Transcript_17075/g.43756 Transcript_17075/m.43756 type:complete len:118 (-) Transcript_17075:420-773(-)
MDEERVTLRGEEEVDGDDDDDPIQLARPRTTPRLMEFNKRVSRIPKLSLKNTALVLLLLLGLGAAGFGAYLKSAPVVLGALAFSLGWCCCPWCALERELKSGEAASLLSGGDERFEI